MSLYDKVSTGLKGFDEVIDHLRFGDNVVWQVESISDYKKMAGCFAKSAKGENIRLIYIRFANHEPILDESHGIKTYHVDAGKGFESFAMEIHNIIKQEGKRAFYVFDCLTDLLEYWHSDLMIGNFFKATCPYLYELDTVAYFALKRNFHTYSTIANIRETTQLLLDLYNINGKTYIHPLKVWQRYSPTMFFPHCIREEEAICITSSADASELFKSIQRGEIRLDYWNTIFSDAKKTLSAPLKLQEETKRRLMYMLIGSDSRMFNLCNRYFTLKDILDIAAREIGTGFIGGKSVGMLLARKILEVEGGGRFSACLEPHDSFYIGADVFYTYIVQNGWWRLRTKQKTPEGYFKYAAELREKLLQGTFPKDIQEQFMQMLEYFGQSPIIVRSSSLLEDNFGNAFAGKYESVFCVNQGTPKERYECFEQAVRIVYASTMNEDALNYRMNRGLAYQDEQMAILVQRVSGDRHGDCFFPHIAGVGNSSNLYVWDSSIDMRAGMLRLVLGLGTRAVDRTGKDYVKIITLDNPLRTPPGGLQGPEKILPAPGGFTLPFKQQPRNQKRRRGFVPSLKHRQKPVRHPRLRHRVPPAGTRLHKLKNPIPSRFQKAADRHRFCPPYAGDFGHPVKSLRLPRRHRVYRKLRQRQQLQNKPLTVPPLADQGPWQNSQNSGNKGRKRLPLLKQRGLYGRQRPPAHRLCHTDKGKHIFEFKRAGKIRSGKGNRLHQ